MIIDKVQFKEKISRSLRDHSQNQIDSILNIKKKYINYKNSNRDMKILDNPLSISSEILLVIKESTEFLYLISPYIQFGKNLYTELKLMKNAILKALKSGIDVNLITRTLDQAQEYNESFYERNLKFMHEEGCKIYFVPYLHSKIYCNESKALITSMNLYLASILNNKEIGILLTKNSEATEHNKIISYALDLTKSA